VLSALSNLFQSWGSRAGFDEPPDLSQKQKPRKPRKKIQHLDGAGRDDDGKWSAIFLDHPPKLTCLRNCSLPRSRYEILGADRGILCNDIWMTSWLKIDRQEVGARLGDNYIVAIHHDSQVCIVHGPGV
jgi:hypothetical protein